jgi:nitrite reductase/ring-hydroxylating ferredoxin subunit
VSRARRLCAVAALPDGAAALIGARRASAQARILLVRRGAQVAGFVNACPHMGLPLDDKPDRLARGGGAFLRCSHHGALFRVADGMCVEGPCLGERLEAVALRIADGVVFLAEASCSA